MNLDKILTSMGEKLGITALNKMQQSLLPTIDSHGHFALYSSIGTGKTLAFLVPLIALLDGNRKATQGLIVSPTRELALQISDVVRKLSLGVRMVVCYGGHDITDEINSLQAQPDVIIATPGRLVDLLGRKAVNLQGIDVLVLDEFDKVLELGFAEEVDKISLSLPSKIETVILTSATRLNSFPNYPFLSETKVIDFLEELPIATSPTPVTVITSGNSANKLDTLSNCLYELPGQKCIVFATQRDTVEQVYNFLHSKKFCCEFLHGKLTQLEREKAIALFENGTYNILVTTDLGARGIDFKDVDSVIHFDCPTDKESHTHRNGRTARYGKRGSVFLICSGTDDSLPDFVEVSATKSVDDVTPKAIPQSHTQTLHFKAGRKEKLSKKDILGFLMKNLNVPACKVGAINVFDHYSLAAVDDLNTAMALDTLNAKKIKGMKVRITKAVFNSRHKSKQA